VLLLAGLDGCRLLLGCRHGLLSVKIPPREQLVLGLLLLLQLLHMKLLGGGGAGGLSLFMTGSDPKRVIFTNPTQPRMVKINIP